ncbi:beta-lactamase family protein [Kordiimonas sp. SCSIO 12603]|uniref:serine hydrolase domain-containing protein n=1 Tax=Kordiimonas sp. SCSIO 12603 TaxID=2829596 RepID=UPI0021064EE9|nr:serine hydrolase domain-containing protein [Kordiimonas sp. SCSIO 12603]UTW59359.1 beta-lactamase family protein [Kordiimonas sp. SCSIO 12603]
MQMFTSAAQTQSIAIPPQNLEASLRDQLVSESSFFVNGPLTYGLTQETANRYYSLGKTAKTILALTALRAAEAGLLDINDPVARHLPEILEDNPFKVQVTLQHLLTETAGFATVPIQNSSSPLRYYAKELRTAGQMAHDDIVGWLVLIKLLERSTGTSIDTVIYTHLLNPLGLPIESIKLPEVVTPSPFQNLLDMKANGQAIAEIVRVLIRNRTKEGAPFLQRYTHDFLIKHHSWRMHPMSDARTLAGVQKRANNRLWLEPAGTDCEKGIFFQAYPAGDVAFIKIGCPTDAYLNAISTTVENSFLPVETDSRQKELEALYSTARFSGLYVRADKPSAWFKDRINFIRDDTLDLSDRGDGTVIIDDGIRQMTYHRTAAFTYASPSGEGVLFSPFKQGGYMLMGDKFYRYVGPLGNKTMVITAVPFVLIVLFSSLFYVKPSFEKPWRRMGQFGSVGTLLVTASIVLEYTVWPTVLFDWQMPWLINLWRFFMNVGLALILSLPLFAISFTRQNKVPAGKAILFVPLHLALLSVAAFAMFLIMVAWGLAGEFSAY